MNTAPKLLSERLLRYSNELSGPSSGELVALLREAATAICDLSHDAALVRQSVEHGWAAAALAPPSGEGVVPLYEAEMAVQSAYRDLGFFRQNELLQRLRTLATAKQDAPAMAGSRCIDCHEPRAKLCEVCCEMRNTTPQSAPVDGMLPHALMDVAHEWYQLCERAPHATKIGISGELAEAIVKTVVGLTTPPPASQERGGDFPVMRSAFVTSESCGHDNDYRLVFRFRSLEALQQAHREWIGAASPPGSAAEDDVTAGGTSTSDDELPGMWSLSDFTGGATDAAEQAKPDEDDAAFNKRIGQYANDEQHAEHAQAVEPDLATAMELARKWCLAWGEWAHDNDPGCIKENAAMEELREFLACRLAGWVTDEAFRRAQVAYKDKAIVSIGLGILNHNTALRAALVAALGAK